MKIRSKLHLAILPTVLIIFGGLTWLSWVESRKALATEIERGAENMLEACILDIDDRMKSTEAAAGILGLSVESAAPSTEDAVGGLIEAALAIETKAYGSTVSFAPGSFAGGPDLVGPYYHRGPSGLVYVNLAKPSYDYPRWDWFKIPMETLRPRWSEPYRDVGGGDVLMTTYSYPFSRNGRPWGVATMDVSLNGLTKMVSEIKVGKRGFAFLISEDGTFLSLRRKEWEKQKTIFDAAKKFESANIEGLGREMIAGGKGFALMTDPLNDEPSWFAYGPIPRTGWSLAIVLPQQEVLEPITQLHWRAVVIAAVGFFMLFVIIFAIARRITDPITELADAARRVANGNLAAKIPSVRTQDEVGQLAAALQGMLATTTDAMQALREEKVAFAAAFSRTSDALVIANSRWQVMQQNPAAEKQIGASLGAALLDRLGECFESSIPLALLTSEAHESASFSLKLKGGTTQFDCCVEPIRDDSGRAKGRVFCAHRIS